MGYLLFVVFIIYLEIHRYQDLQPPRQISYNLYRRFKLIYLPLDGLIFELVIKKYHIPYFQ